MKNIVYVFVVSLFVLAYSCKQKQNDKIPKNENQVFERLKYLNVEETENWSLVQIQEKYQHLTEWEYPLNDGFPEFRVGLQNVFPEEDWDKPIPLKEVTWQLNDSLNITIWYKKEQNNWIKVDKLIWPKEAEF